MPFMFRSASYEELLNQCVTTFVKVCKLSLGIVQNLCCNWTPWEKTCCSRKLHLTLLEGQKETDGVRTAQPPKRRNSGTTLQVLFTVSQTGMNEVCVTTDKGDASNEPVAMLDINC